MEALKVVEVTKQYSGHKALDKVCIDVPEGSIFGLLGPNGAGKTSLIRIINQITAPDSGHIFFNNRPLSAKDISQIGYLPEERGLYKKMKVGEQALYLAQLKGLSKADAMEKLKFWFKKFDLGSWWNKKVEELSKGMQQKVQFIVTVLHEPKLLIFDEPFSGFDPINVNLLKQEILNLRQKGATIIFSTHNMASVEELCSHIALINKAKKILDGSVPEIKESFKKNIFEIVYRNQQTSVAGFLPDSFTLVGEEPMGNMIKSRIILPDGETPNRLLQLAIAEVEVHAFSEILPTMNDIFIAKVNEFENHS